MNYLQNFIFSGTQEFLSLEPQLSPFLLLLCFGLLGFILGFSANHGILTYADSRAEPKMCYQQNLWDSISNFFPVLALNTISASQLGENTGVSHCS
jgi:hypothetical protein